MPGGWSGSTRAKRLPANWRAIRARVLDRDQGRCTAVEHGQRCGYAATDVDHIDRHGSQADPDNLASLCAWHHGRKTAAEGNRARSRNRREPEAHPGMTNPRRP